MILENRSCHSMPIAPTDSGWHMLLPAGRFMGRDGRGPYLNDDPESILAAFNQMNMPLPIDYHHQSETAEEKIGLVPAAGWGSSMKVQEGAIYVQIQWTDAAQAAIDKKEVMYLSPVFEYDPKTTRVLRIVAAGLTNLPNLHLTSLTQHEKKQMEDVIEYVCRLLNLPLTSTKDEIKLHLQRLMDSIGESSTSEAAQCFKGLALSLGLPDTTAWSQVAKVANERVGNLESSAMTLQGQYQATLDELASLKKAILQDEINREVASAKQSGKLTPALEEWARDYASRDLAGFREWKRQANSYLPVSKEPRLPIDGFKPLPQSATEIVTAATAYQCEKRSQGIEIDDVTAVLHVTQQSNKKVSV